MRWCSTFLILGLCGTPIQAWQITSINARQITTAKDAATGWDVFTLTQGQTSVRIVPAAGANAFSVVHRGTEYLRVPDELKNLPGVGHGNPVLYPMPNRVKGAKFRFEGKTYEFPKNGSGNFIHGLVHSEAFSVEAASASSEQASLTMALRFEPGTERYRLFPFEHVFRLTVAVREGVVTWSYEVDNEAGSKNLPFGFALHPYVIYQKSRQETYLQVPATHLMESSQQLPSGKLLTLDGHPLDARQPRSLAGFNADDVYFGMQPDRPAKVEFRDVNHSITFKASKEFTHLVVWTPDRGYFGIENQTCSTDAHNLASQGMGDVAHLQVCPTGEKRTGSVAYHFD